MVIDTSALIAILVGEQEADQFLQGITRDPKRLISAATLVESGIVMEARRGDAGGRELDLLLHRAQVRVVPVDEPQAEIARSAYRRFGKGRHPAALNFGDCFSYALSRVSGEPILAKGDEFKRAGMRTC